MNLNDFYRQHLAALPIMPLLLAQAGISVPRDGLIRAPDHVYEDRNASIKVYPEHLVDYGNDKKGYGLLKVAREWLGLDTRQSIALLCDLAGIRRPESVEPYQGKIKKASFVPPLPEHRRDPNEFAVFATRASESLASPTTPAAIMAAEYLIQRDLYAAALHYGCGVADSATHSRPPWRKWSDLITFPTWWEGGLIALKGRNTLPKPERIMLNLKGATTAPYGIRELRNDGPVLVVEGETDVQSVWTAFEGEVNVVGIPGAPHWERLKHPALEGRRLYVCLDTDEAGKQAMTNALMWAADEGRRLSLVPGVGDKNAILVPHGPAHLRTMLKDAISSSSRRVKRDFA